MYELWSDVETKMEGKTIDIISFNGYGIIIRFTDGSCFKQINGNVEFEDV